MRQIPLFKVYTHPDCGAKVQDVLDSGYIGQGKVVERFEGKLKEYLGCKYAATVNSGTSALHLALHLLKKPDKNMVQFHGVAGYESGWPGLKDGDEVLTSPLTCTATNWPILANGLKIKWVDVNAYDLNINISNLRRKLSKKTKVIMVVHWGGYPVDLDELKQIQDDAKKKFGFRPAIIEDCAHAFGSTYNGVKIGNHGNICCFSFQAIKHINSGDGGLLVLPHQKLNDRAKLLRWYGIDRDSPRRDFRCEENIEEWGYKFHMNDINAAIGLTNLSSADWIINKHRSNAKMYRKRLQNIKGLKYLSNEPDRESSYWLYTILVKNRDNLMKYLTARGISCSRVHERNDKHTCVKQFATRLPSLDWVVDHMLCLPVGWWVSEEDIEYICACIREFYLHEHRN